MSLSLRIENKVGYIEFDRPDSKVNILSSEVIKRFDVLLDQVAAGKEIDALVILSRKKDIFIAGADIQEIEKIRHTHDGMEKAGAGQAVLNKLEDLKIPTIAVIDGAALGGGCELALACSYRLATFNDKVKIGLPEVSLGFIPGFGGTYRLCRLVGLEEGLKMILSGRPVDGFRAFKIGLVDRLVPQNGLADYISQFLAEMRGRKMPADKYGSRRQKGIFALLKNSPLIKCLIYRQSRRSVLALSKGFYPAPLAAIDVISKTYHLSRKEALALESKTFGELAVSEISKNLIRVFHLSEKFRKLTVDDAAAIVPACIEKCGILGAGVMGGGIAHLLSSKGIWVRLKDIQYDAIAKGFRAAGKLYGQAVGKRKMTRAQADQGMARITGTLDYSGFGNAGMVIEAVVEDIRIKKKVFEELSAVMPKGAILATNTSALSVTEIARAAQDPSRVVGFHFFNPVHRMPLVEIIAAPTTSKETLVSALELARRLGKTPILVKDACGFIVNRILLGYINEAGHILQECGRMELIDGLMTDFGMPMGPFALSDEVGLDIGVKVLHILHDGLGERYRPAESFEAIYAKGLLGKKSGKGFYIHTGRRRPNGEISGFLGAGHLKPFAGDEYLKRMVYGMINESARCLQDGVVDGADAIDAGMIFGVGFPPFRGGLLRYADSVGAGRVVGELQRFADGLKAGRFEPCAYLMRLKEKGKGFYDV